MDEEMVIAGGGRLSVGCVPTVTDPGVSRKRNIFPVTTQYDPTISDSDAWPAPSSFKPATRISKEWDAPSQSKGSHGVISISCSRKSKASMPTIGLQKPGTIPIR